MKLTVAQRRMLEEVVARGPRIYNGRARRTIEALERAGLVIANWDMVLTAKGGGTSPVWRITVTAVSSVASARQVG